MGGGRCVGRWANNDRLPPDLPRRREPATSHGEFFVWYADRDGEEPIPIRYPTAIVNAEGDSVGEIGAPPGTFKPVPVFEPGTLTPGQYSTGSSNALAGYNTISRIDAVGSHLILTHGQYDSARFLRSRHSTVDIYDRQAGVKLYEDIPLPERSRILGGGRYLYMLLDTDFPPWRVARLQFRTYALAKSPQ